MKIEIEFEEVESLKNKLREKSIKIRKLEDKLKNLDEDKLKSDAVSMAKNLFREYMDYVYRELGFEETSHSYYEDPFRVSSGTLEHWLGGNWYRNDKILVTLGANVSNRWRHAFLKFGIKTDLKK